MFVEDDVEASATQLRGKIISGRVSERVSERECLQRFSEVFTTNLILKVFGNFPEVHLVCEGQVC